MDNKVHILYIIGNGFDLSRGLNTRFSDFCDYYKKLESQNEAIQNLKKENIESWADFELSFGKYTEKITSQDELETIYYDIHDKLIDYLRKEQKKYQPTDREIQQCRVDLCLPYIYLEPVDAKIIKTGFRNLPDETEIIIDIISLNYTNVFERAVNFSDSPLSSEKYNLSSSLNRPTHFGTLLHLHGSIEEDSIIFGVDNESQISNRDFSSSFSAKNLLIKTSANESMMLGRVSTAHQLINNSDLIVVMGSSIGASDRHLWMYLYNSLENSKPKKVILHYYTGQKIPNSRRALLGTKVAQVQSIYNKIIKDPRSPLRSMPMMVALDKDIFPH